VALLLQLTLVDRLPLPGGAPDLVLLVVVALGLTGGPVAGMLTGFWAGLALDVAPPAGYLVGEHALVFCLVGYGCGRLSGMTDRSAASSLGIAAMAAAGGEVLQVIVGLMFGDPGVSWPAIRIVLPSAVLQDILVSPFVVYLMMRASSWAAARRLGSAAAAAASPGRCPACWERAGAASPTARCPERRAAPAGWLARLVPAAAGSPACLARSGSATTRPGRAMAGSAAGRGRGERSGARYAAASRSLRPGAGQAGSATAGQVHRRRPASPVSIRMGSGGAAVAVSATRSLAGCRASRHRAERAAGQGGTRGSARAAADRPAAEQRRTGSRPGQRWTGGAGLGSTGWAAPAWAAPARVVPASAALGCALAGLGRAGLRGARLGSGWLRGAGPGGAGRGGAVRGGAR
jgi:rod shape-determining protein MreD